MVFHLGALIPIPYSYQHPREFVEANVVGTLNVLEACAAGRRRSHRAHVDERGLRHARRRVPIAEEHPLHAAVAVRRDEDRRRPARAELLRARSRRPSSSRGRSTRSARASRRAR